MTDASTNLRFLRRSRKPLSAGDIFAMQLPNEFYLFGRVILVEPPYQKAPGPSCNLIYIYAAQSQVKAPDLNELTSDKLLIAPMWTNRLGWTRGVFETVTNQPLRSSDLLKQHCFWDPLRNGYLDEEGLLLNGQSEPCGEWGLVSYRYIDNRISDALGFPPMWN
jgi:hypothetical protein